MTLLPSQSSNSLSAFIPFLLRCYLVLVPVMWSPFSHNIQWADLVFVVLFLCFLGSEYLGRPRLIWLDYLVLTYLVTAAVSLIHIEDPSKQGLEFLKLAYLGSIYLVVGTLCSERSTLDACIRWTTWLTVAIAGVGLLALLGNQLWSLPASLLGVRLHTPYLGEILRLHGTFPGPELLGNYLTAGLPIVLALVVLSGNESRRWLGVGVLVILVAEVFTFSHSWVGLASAALIFSWPLSKDRAWKIARAVLAVGVIGLFTAMLFVSTFYITEVTVDLKQGQPPAIPVPVHAKVAQDQWRSLDISATYSLMSYQLLKALAWDTFLTHPLTGVGRGNFDSVSTKAVNEGRLAEYWKGIHPHTSIFGEFAETGLLGGVAFLALWTGTFMTAHRLMHAKESDAHAWIARASLAALAGLFLNGLYTDIMNFRFLWVALALLRGLSSASRRSHTG